jgi:hypothetical protein
VCENRLAVSKRGASIQLDAENHSTSTYRRLVMAGFNSKDLEQGRIDALRRLQGEGFPITGENLDAALNLVTEVLAPWPAELNPRFVRLFTENVAVAVAARAAYQESPLTRDEATAYLAVDSWFKNSWHHA